MQDPKAASPIVPSQEADKKPERSLGQRIFDTIIYGGVINTLVFGVSVVATFLTRHGDKMGGSVGKWFHGRSTDFQKKLVEDWKIMSPSAAKNFNMVAWSFLDGSIFAFLAKPLEDQRENIARSIDKRFSKEPVSEETYRNEPKQSWLSVIGGRIATFSIVFPTYLLLEKLHINAKQGFKNLNKVLFSDLGETIGNKINNIGIVKKNFPRLANNETKIKLPEAFEVGIFEAVYTTVCTIGLYVGSRFFASKSMENKHAPTTTTHASKTAQAALSPQDKAMAMTPALSMHSERAENAPSTRVSDMGLLDRQMASPVMAPAH